MKSRKNLIIIALVVLVSVVGLSYAFFNYYMVSQKNLQLITGEIYLRLDDGTDEVMLLNAFPETREEARARNDNYITFTITGKNTTTNHDIHYEIDLNEGDPVADRTRLNPSDLRFDLVEIRGEDEVYVVWDESFENFDEKRIWVDHVFKNTTEEVERVYKLRMWISDDVLISDTDPNASYTTGEYKNSYASVKVSVFGDFNEKATDASCFTTEIASIANIRYAYTSYDINTTDEGIATCKTIMMNSLFDYDYSDDADGYQKVCEGTGTFMGTYTMNAVIGSNLMSIRDKLIEANYITNYTGEVHYYSLNKNAKARNACESYISINYPDIPLESCRDQEKFRENSLKFLSKDIDYFLENGVLTRDEGAIPASVYITDYDETCGSEVFIPTTINGATVSTIGLAYNDDGSTKNVIAFQNKNLEKVVIPSIVKVNSNSFKNNNLRSIVLPLDTRSYYLGSETYSYNKLEYVYFPAGTKNIGSNNFSYNELIEVDLPEGLEVISLGAFSHNKIESLYIPDSVTNIGLRAFNDNLLPDDEGFIYKRTDTDNDDVSEIDYTKIISYGGANKDVIIPEGVVTIGTDAFNDCKVKSVRFSNTVTTIEDDAFSENEITDLVISNTITTIGGAAFQRNKIVDLVIPNSVTSIGYGAFAVGPSLKTVTIGNGITYIGHGAFTKLGYYDEYLLNNSNLTSITIDKPCNEIRTIPSSSTDATLYYPWLNMSNTIFTAPGVTIYGANGEVCDTY